MYVSDESVCAYSHQAKNKYICQRPQICYALAMHT
jgi:hypothetical protein